MRADTNTTKLSEASSLLRDTPEIRPYQAYCNTEISSCPSSPENLSPSPLRVIKAYSKQVDMSAQTSTIDSSEQGISLTRVATSSPDKQVDFPTSVPRGNHTGKQNQGTRQRSYLWSISTATPDHTTQPINPHGSHSLGGDEVTVYDSDPAITRVQLSTKTDRVTEHAIQRKPVPGDGGASGIIYRPLPQIPLRRGKLTGQDQPRSAYKHKYVQCPPKTMAPSDNILKEEDTEKSLRYCQGGDNVLLMPSLDPLSHDELSAEILRLLPGDSSLSEPTSPSYNVHVRHCEPTAQAELGATHTRRFLSAEPGSSLGNAHNVDDEATAGSPDDFGDIEPESPNAQMPPPRPEPTLQTLFHQRSHEPFLQTRAYTPPHPAPSFHSSTDTQNGPRPPPWGTYDDLALQRRQRNELRGRMQDVPRDVVRETMLTYQQRLSAEGRGGGLEREVNEYREQILSVYPDMVFDGRSGEGDRECMCCLAM